MPLLAAAAPPPLRAWVNPHLVPLGCIGAPQAGDALPPQEALRAAEDWLRAQGCTRACGPMAEGSTWHTYRANLGPFDRPPFLGEPQADPAPWLACGYRVLRRYHTTAAPHPPLLDGLAAREARLSGAGWRLETLDHLGTFSEALDLFYALSQAAFADNFLYSPLDRAAFGALYAPLQAALVPPMVLLARAPDGHPAGFCLSYPDLLNPALRQGVIKTLAVVPAHRGSGVSGWLVGAAHRAAQQQGLTGGALHALMIDDNLSTHYSRGDSVQIRAYALFEKVL